MRKQVKKKPNSQTSPSDRQKFNFLTLYQVIDNFLFSLFLFCFIESILQCISGYSWATYAN